MKIFDEPNIFGGWTCPICGTNEKKPITLIEISGTEEGNNIQAEQFHLDCIELSFIKSPFNGLPFAKNPNKHLIAQIFEDKRPKRIKK